MPTTTAKQTTTITTVNMHQAKSQLSKLVEAVESGQENEVIIARNGKPVARLVPIAKVAAGAGRIGVARGLFEVPDSIDEDNAAIEVLMLRQKN